MENNLITVSYSVDNYKGELEHFYKKVKNLFLEINKLNTQKELFNNLVPSVINNEADLKQNKACIDSINTLFKPLEIINTDIKKTLNNWKSNFAGKTGLDTLIDNIKNELIKSFKQEQIKYDQLIQEKIKNEEIALKEQATIKCIAKGCKNKVIIELKVVDMSNASKIFFKFCPEHQKMYDDKIKQDYQDQEKIKKEITQEAVKSSINNDKIKKNKIKDKE